MKAYLKKFLLKHVNQPFETGFRVVIWPSIVVMAIMAIFRQYDLAAISFWIALLLAVACGLFQGYITRKYVSRPSYWLKHNPILLRAVNGRVTESGKALWGRENIFTVVLPESETFSIKTEISQIIRGLTVSIDITLNVKLMPQIVSDGTFGFKPQELYDLVCVLYHKSVAEALTTRFLDAAYATPDFMAIFERYYINPQQNIAALIQDALPNVKFNPAFSNIDHVDVRADVNSLTQSVRIRYW